VVPLSVSWNGGQPYLVFASEDEDGIHIVAEQHTDDIEPRRLDVDNIALGCPIEVGTQWVSQYYSAIMRKQMPMAFTITEMGVTHMTPLGQLSNCIAAKGGFTSESPTEPNIVAEIIYCSGLGDVRGRYEERLQERPSGSTRTYVFSYVLTNMQKAD
jgi:hypothetical protein